MLKTRLAIGKRKSGQAKNFIDVKPSRIFMSTASIIAQSLSRPSKNTFLRTVFNKLARKSRYLPQIWLCRFSIFCFRLGKAFSPHGNRNFYPKPLEGHWKKRDFVGNFESEVSLLLQWTWWERDNFQQLLLVSPPYQQLWTRSLLFMRLFLGKSFEPARFAGVLLIFLLNDSGEFKGDFSCSYRCKQL